MTSMASLLSHLSRGGPRALWRPPPQTDTVSFHTGWPQVIAVGVDRTGMSLARNICSNQGLVRWAVYTPQM